MTREEIIEFIRNLFDKDKGNTLNKELKIHKEVDEFLQKMIDDEPWFESKRRAFSCVARGIFHKVVCPTCGQDIPVVKAIQGRTHCSSKCNSNDSETRKKAMETNIERYGSENPFASDKIKEKIRKTNIERYGVDNPFKNDEIKKKIKSVMMDRYGVESSLQSKEIREKFKNTMLQRYGVDSPLRSEEIKNRVIQTNLRKFGHEWNFQSEEFKEKSRETCLRKYGCEHTGESSEVRAKMLQTNLKRYNVKNPLQSREIRQKGIETIIKKYGCEYVSQIEDVKKKIKETSLKKYGVENPMQCEEVRNKVKKTNFERYGYEKIGQCPEFIEQRIKTVHSNTYDRMLSELSDDVIPMFTREEYVGLANGNDLIEYEWKCVHCGKMFRRSVGNVTHAPKCSFCGYVFSSGEMEIINLIKSNCDSEIVTHTRQVLPSHHELDIYLPDRKVAIEYNGLYWHSIENGKDKEYHISKSIECEQLGIHLIHVFGDEWKKRKDEISSFIVDAITLEDKSEILMNHLGLLEQAEDGFFISRSYFNAGLLTESKCMILKTIEPQSHVFSIKNGKMLDASDDNENDNCMTFYDCGGFIIMPPRPLVEQIWSMN